MGKDRMVPWPCSLFAYQLPCVVGRDGHEEEQAGANEPPGHAEEKGNEAPPKEDVNAVARTLEKSGGSSGIQSSSEWSRRRRRGVTLPELRVRRAREVDTGGAVKLDRPFTPGRGEARAAGVPGAAHLLRRHAPERRQRAPMRGDIRDAVRGDK